MNHILCKPARLWTLVLLLLGSTISAQDLSETRNISKEFPVGRESSLEIENKYGRIDVHSWERDLVKIDVEILLTESSQSKLKKLKETIAIEFGSSRTKILAKSVFSNESGKIARELKNVSAAISGSNKHVEINYDIHIPSYLKLVLTNKYGDIYLDDLEGDIEIVMSNGVLNAGMLSGRTNIDMGFANGMIKSLGLSNMKAIYSDLVIGEAGQLELESKSTTVKIDSVNMIDLNSRRDKFHLQKVEQLFGQTSYTQVWIYDFLRESNIHMKYGKLTIEHVYPDFNKIYVASEYADISLYFDKESQFAFDILHHEKSMLRLPEREVMAREQEDGEEHFRTTGTMGGEEDGSGEVSIDALQKCFINLSTK